MTKHDCFLVVVFPSLYKAGEINHFHQLLKSREPALSVIDKPTMAKKNKTPKQDEAPKKAKREVKVVKCPSAFPISTKAKKRPRGDGESFNSNNRAGRNQKETKLLDLHQTAKEIRAYGAQAFIGKQKRDYEDEKYYQLTGRHKKKNSCPLPLVRGLRRAAEKRERKAREEARKSGLVIPKEKEETSKKSMTDADYRKFGPAPNIGFMKSGVYRVSKNNNNKIGGNSRRR